MTDVLQMSFALVSNQSSLGLNSSYSDSDFFNSGNAADTAGGPSASTMSRASMKLEVAHLILRQDQWQMRNTSNNHHFVQLGFLDEHLKTSQTSH